MDIQRGDTVYYRGEVWTVVQTGCKPLKAPVLKLQQKAEGGWYREHWAYPSAVQRVEQVQ